MFGTGVSSPSRRRKAATANNANTTTGAAVSGSSSSTPPRNSALSLLSKSPERGKRHRDNVLFQQRHCIPLALLVMTCLVFGGVSVYNTRYHSTVGLYVPFPPGHFAPAPLETRRSVCVDQAQTTVVRAFRERGWKIIPLRPKSDDPNDHYLSCYQKGNAAIIWTKLIPHHHWNASFPWQRHSQMPFEAEMSQKARTVELLRLYEKTQGRTLSFIPESYVLPQDRDALLKRLTVGPDAAAQLRGSSNSAPGGGASTATAENEPWVLKLSAIDNGTW